MRAPMADEKKRWMAKARLRKIAHFLRTRFLRSDQAAELIELAASLPLLVVFMVGIYDFSSAFITKQKITQITAEATRIAVNEPTSDFNTVSGACQAPTSICGLRTIIASALTSNGINDCGLAGASATNTPPTFTWQFTSSNGTCSGLVLIIERGKNYFIPLQPPFQPNYEVEATRITLIYPYQWQFSRVIGLIAPGANYTNSPIQSVAVMQNLN